MRKDHNCEASSQENKRINFKSKTIAIFGPPGSGKTTLCSITAFCMRWRAIDLETLWKIGKDGRLRDDVLRHLNSKNRRCHGTIIGAAGTSPLDYHADIFKVLLLPSFKDYLKLIEIRRIKQPGKLVNTLPSTCYSIHMKFARQIAQDAYPYHKIIYTPCFNRNLFKIVNSIKNSAMQFFKSIDYDKHQSLLFGCW